MHITNIRLCVLALPAALATHVSAQTNLYPNKPVKIIVPFAPGGGSDFIARLLSQRLIEKLGQPVIVDNKLPDVPTVIESGYPDYSVTNWHGVVAPKGLPRDILLKLNAAINDSLNASGMEAGMASDGLSPAVGTPEEFGALLAAEVTRWGALVKQRNMRAA